MLRGNEQCDDGDASSGDGCSAICAVESGWSCLGAPSQCSSICGDGIIRGAEVCDDGNINSNDGCSASCTVETGYTCAGTPSSCAAICGDGLKRGTEQCDDGDTGAGDGCSSTCSIETGWSCSGTPSACAPICGDGLKSGNEACDDANLSSGDGCSATCAVESGWSCSGTPSTCDTICGDGLIRAAETCDDGNASPGDGCSGACAVESGWTCTGTPSSCATTCGDAIVAGAETCDDGNATGGDCCSAMCTIEPGCEVESNDSIATANDWSSVNVSGRVNGFVDPTTDLDLYSITLNHSGNAQLIAETLDGVLGSTCASNSVDTYVTLRNAAGTALKTDEDGGEGQCSKLFSNALPAGQYFVEVKRSPFTGVVHDYALQITVNLLVCGNGVLEVGERCDDGNVQNGDGCSSTCTWETTPETEPNDSAGTATAVPLSSEPLMSGSISYVGDVDWYSFTLLTTSDVALETFDSNGPNTCSSVDTTLELFASDGTTSLAFDDYDGVSMCSRIDASRDVGARQLPPGTYYVKVSEYGSNSTIPGYTLRVEVTSVCGDGVVQGYEECDGGPNCTASCQRVPVCGDGYIDGSETCDDGNTSSGDGCSSSCLAETTPELEPNDSTADAAASALQISSTTRVSGAIATQSDRDMFQVTVSSPSVVRFEAHGPVLGDCPSGMDTTLRLYDSGGVQLSSDNTSGIGSCSALVLNLAPGSYFVSIEDASMNETIAGYILETIFHSNGGTEIEPNEMLASATPLSGNDVQVWGSHQLNADADWYSITLPPGRSVRIELIEGGSETCESNGVDGHITLYDAAGNELVKDDDAGRGYCSRIDGTGSVAVDPGAHSLAGGTYYLQVTASPLISGTSPGGQFDYRLAVTIR